MKVACNPFSQHGSDTKPVRFDLKLVDPKGHWVSTELECETDMVVGTNGGYAGTPMGDQDPVTAVEESLKGLEPDDVVEVGGYPEADAPTVRVVRDEKVIGVYGFVEAEDRGLVRGGSSVCASAGLRG